MERACKKCGETKPIEEFGKNTKQLRDTIAIYIMGSCKKCISNYNLKYNKNHKKEMHTYNIKNYDKERRKKYYEIRKDEIRDTCRLYGQTNKNKLYEKRKEYLKNHPDIKKELIYRKVRELQDCYIIANIKKSMELDTKTIRDNPELIENYRQYVKVKRLLKSKKNDTSTKTS